MLQETAQAYVILRLFSALPTQEPTITVKELLPEAAAVISAVKVIAMVQGGQVSLEAAVPIQIITETQEAAVFLEIAVHRHPHLLHHHQTIIVVAAGLSVTVAAAVPVLQVQEAAVQQLLQAVAINCYLDFQFSKL